MPAINMGGEVAENPSTGKPVLMSPFSGPDGSPLDNDQAGNHSTGALSTGIGFGQAVIVNPPADPNIKRAGFTDDYTPGLTLPSGSAASDARLTAIGGGRSNAADGGKAETVPFDAQPLLGFGNGGSRDAGAGPAHTGFAIKTVTASGSVANGNAVETGWINRSNKTLTTGESTFGSSNTASPAVDYRGTITADLTINNTTDEASATGTVVDVEDDQIVTVVFTQGDDSITVDVPVESGAYDTEEVDISGFEAGSVTVTASVVDRFGYTVTATDSGTYTPE